MRIHKRVAMVGAAAAVLALVPAVAAATGNDSRTPRPFVATGGLSAVGLTADGTALGSFLTYRPTGGPAPRAITGLAGDTALVGIDYRVQDGKLYGVGNSGGIYTIVARTAVATQVSQLSVALDGASFGVDFNPAANRLRVISDTGQNLRHNIDDGATAGTTLVDGTLAYPPATTPALGVTAAAYTNNDLVATTATTLFDVDTTLDQVALQSPANAGSLAATGKLGVDAGSAAGLDIYSSLRDGVSVRSTALATLSVGGQQRLYEIDLLTGTAIDKGRLNRSYVDIAIPLSR